MRVLFIRHGDPDYANDTLTDRGRIEAKLLSDTKTIESIADRVLRAYEISTSKPLEIRFINAFHPLKLS